MTDPSIAIPSPSFSSAASTAVPHRPIAARTKTTARGADTAHAAAALGAERP
jgi:hypothetical protein